MKPQAFWSALMLGAAPLAPWPALAQVEAVASAPADYADLIALQSASDRMNLELDKVVQAAITRGSAERLAMTASAPIQAYLKKIQAAVEDEDSAEARAPAPMEPDDIPPLVERDLVMMEALEADILTREVLAARGKIDDFGRARANGVAIKLRTAASIEAWGRLVAVVPPGEVIENDPIDVAHARLEDLTLRREELQAELKTKPTSAAMRSILRELAGIDRQINAAIFQITGVVWFHRAGKVPICHPPAVKGRPVAWFNCEYWALNTPFVVNPSGENITVDRVLIDIDEDAGGLRSARIAYYTRSQGQPPSSEPTGGASGEFRRMPDGTLQLVVKEVDESGEERERLYPFEVTTDEGKGLLPGFSSHGPFKLKFKRDPKAYISYQEAQAAMSELVPLVGQKPPPASPQPAPGSPEDDFLAPLVDTAPTPAPGSPEDDFLAPLVEPAPAPAPGSPDDDFLAPLVNASPAPAQPASSVGTPDDDFLAPLVPPN